jgi:SAM-dependent methyltransferase
MTCASEFWDALAPDHASLEDNYLDVPSLDRIAQEIRQPVLVVGAGQGLIVAELLRLGFQTDGVDLSAEMIRYARIRRGLIIAHANAKALPFAAGSYETIIYATGVVDFIGDDEEIKVILAEARRVVSPTGQIFVAFYKMSTASEEFLARLGLISDNVLSFRETLELYRMNPVQMMAWVARRAKVGFLRAGMLSLRAWALSTMSEKRAGLSMQRIFRNADRASLLINTAPERQPYRNESEVRNLFNRLSIPVKKLENSRSCYIVRI